MSMTPGPWKVDGRTVYALELAPSHPRGWSVQQNRFHAGVQGPTTTPQAELEANARAIAETPAMVEVLKAMLDPMPEGDWAAMNAWTSRQMELPKQARAILARIEGRE